MIKFSTLKDKNTSNKDEDNDSSKTCRRIRPGCRVFKPCKDQEGMFFTEPKDCSVKKARLSLNKKAQNLGLKRFFKVDSSLKLVIISAEDFKKWNEALKKKSEVNKAKLIKPIDRIFEPLKNSKKILFTRESHDMLEVALSNLNQKAKKLGLSQVFYLIKGLDGIAIKKENLNSWIKCLKKEEKQRKSKTMRIIRFSDRKFSPVKGNPELYITIASNAQGLADRLNKKAKSFNMGNVFSVDKENSGVVISKKEYMVWNTHIKDEKFVRTTMKKASQRKFEKVEGKSGLYITFDKDVSLKKVAISLNKKSNSFGLGAVFQVNEELKGVIVTEKSFKDWTDALKKDKGKKKAKKIKPSDRKFSPIEGQPGMYITYAVGSKPSILVCNLNRKSKSLNLGKIFILDNKLNGVKVSKENLDAWEKKLDQENRKPKRIVRKIKMSSRKFELLEGQDKLLITYAEKDKLTNLARNLNRKAVTLGLNKIFKLQSQLKGITVSIENYYSWLLVLAQDEPKNNQLQKKLDDFERSQFSSHIVRFGIHRKYLNLSGYLPPLPKEFGQGDYACPPGLDKRFELSRLSGFSSNIERNPRIFKEVKLPTGSVLKWGTCGQDLDINKRVSFVFAGRKLDAFVPDASNHHTIVVLTQEEYDEIADKLSTKVDVLIVKSLISKSHGDYAEHIGSINCRRIAAICFAYIKGISKCVFMDDNLQAFSCAKEALNTWEGLWDYLSSTMSDSICRSIKTYRVGVDVFKSTIGSKIFMVDILKIRTKFKNAEDCFSLFYPSKMSVFWGEDCYNQSILIQAFGTKAISMVPQEECVLHRSKQHKNLCAKSVKKANFYHDASIETLNLNYNLNELSKNCIKWIYEAIKAMQENVKCNLQYQQSRENMFIQADLFLHHARANEIPYSLKKKAAKKKTGLTVYNDFKTMFGKNNERRQELERAANLYSHQKVAIEKIINFKGKKGLIQMTTGSGKTLVQIVLSNMAFENGFNGLVIIVTPTQELVRQFYIDFIEFLKLHPEYNLKPYEVLKVSSRTPDISAGLLCSNKSLMNKRCVLLCCKASYLKMLGSNVHLQAPNLLLVDECHKFSQDEKLMIEEKSRAVLTLGLTATPKLNSPFSSKVLFNFTRLQAVKRGIIPPFIYDTLGVNYSFEEKEKMISELCIFLIQHLHPCGEPLQQLKGIIYCPSILDAQKARVSIKHLDLDSYLIHSQSNTAKLDIQTFKQAKTGIAFVVDMLKIGYSDQNLDYVLLLKPANNPNMVSQIAGRVMRGKDKVAYVMGFNDANVHNFKTLCDDKALAMCHPNYLKQSRRKAPKLS